jgi:hypothetical protein
MWAPVVLWGILGLGFVGWDSMIVARPHTIAVQAWDGHRFVSKPLDTGKIAYADNEIPVRELSKIPDPFSQRIKSIIYFHAKGSMNAVMVENDVQWIFSQLAPRFEPSPIALPVYALSVVS